MKKYLIILLILVVAFSAFGRGTPAPDPDPDDTTPKKVEEPKPAAKPAIKNPDTFVYATYGTIDSLDAAKAYDTASWSNMRNIYETLVFYKGTATDVYVPLVAAEVPTEANGGIINGGATYRFKIRKGIKFHNGYELTPEDVEYSFERNFVVDPDGGPCWIWFFLFTDGWGSRDGDGNISITYEEIDKFVEVDGDYVVFNLKSAFPPFLGVVSGAWASILSKQWVAEQGGWDGSADFAKWNNPPEDEETLWDIANGTGPYKLERWEKGVEMVLERNENYWGPKPALKRGIYKVVQEWSTRKLMLLQGDADYATVDALYYPEMDTEAGLTVYRDLPSLSIGGINFNQKIAATDNPLIFSGKLDGEGIPPDFFSDKNVRLAFTHCWDVDTYLRDIMNNTAMNPVTPVVTGLPFKNPNVKSLPFDKAKAEEYLKKAWGGKLWEAGFKVDFLHNTGNEVRESGLKMLAEHLMSINPKFKISVRAVEWSEYVDNIRKSNMPIFFVGWAPDYPDPDNYVNPYMHSSGHFASQVGYKNEEADRLVEEGAIELDPAKREAMYFRLQEIWIEDVPGIMTHQPLSRRYMKDWVKGHYYNPMQSSIYDLLAELRKE
jgi:peptide/nickel transport system substrate-binding protein